MDAIGILPNTRDLEAIVGNGGSSSSSSGRFDAGVAADDGLLYSYDNIVLPPPTTSHGTYFSGTNDDVENLDEYQEGGYHPVHLNDFLDHGRRYRVLHKLGHGGFSTIWLCRDHDCARYVAVKVMTAEFAADEVAELTILRQLDRRHPGARYVALPLDTFSRRGPNGTHQCIVLPLLGQCSSPDLWLHLDDDPAPVLKSLCRQSVLALDCLHKSGIGHGDFRPANILIKLANLDSLREDELLSLVGPPDPGDVFTSDGKPLPSCSPRYLVPAADLSKLTAKFFSREICLVDFGESFLATSPPADLGTPESYLPPEMLIDDRTDPVGLTCDIWALGCTLVDLRLQMPLFHMLYGPDEVLNEMVSFFGKFPPHWWARWKHRREFRDQDGKPFQTRIDVDGEPYSIDSILRGNRQVMTTVDGVLQLVKTMRFPPDEMLDFKDLLIRVCAYAPADRPDTREILQHKWFQ